MGSTGNRAELAVDKGKNLFSTGESQHSLAFGTKKQTASDPYDRRAARRMVGRPFSEDADEAPGMDEIDESERMLEEILENVKRLLEGPKTFDCWALIWIDDAQNPPMAIEIIKKSEMASRYGTDDPRVGSHRTSGGQWLFKPEFGDFKGWTAVLYDLSDPKSFERLIKNSLSEAGTIWPGRSREELIDLLGKHCLQGGPFAELVWNDAVRYRWSDDDHDSPGFER